MGKIVFSRVDFRLIHGQVVTKWIKQFPANTIVIVNDELAKNDFMADIYEMSAPSDVNVVITSLIDAVETIGNINGTVFVLFKDIETAVEAIKQGLPVEQLVIGGVPKVGNKKMVSNAVYLNNDDMGKLDSITSLGVKITTQAIPEDRPLTMEDLKKKIS